MALPFMSDELGNKLTSPVSGGVVAQLAAASVPQVGRPTGPRFASDL